ncbi:hypothetical protein [Mycobacterium sp. 852002-51613_SCH5001154]|uniref:hypothetical protein n=1 Tax=Mycobacterium sp. 852002-51613_SCH5001154 TaxID=1834104 RepID=UPI0012E80555|nr:hypothetical protein [Mycobacterium sp. 852002-51613_SCH5001154]
MTGHRGARRRRRQRVRRAVARSHRPAAPPPHPPPTRPSPVCPWVLVVFEPGKVHKHDVQIAALT